MVEIKYIEDSTFELLSTHKGFVTAIGHNTFFARFEEENLFEEAELMINMLSASEKFYLQPGAYLTLECGFRNIDDGREYCERVVFNKTTWTQEDLDDADREAKSMVEWFNIVK
jgi:hypothetical protein